MITAVFRAIADVLSPEFRGILWTALGLSLGLFIAVFAGVEFLLYSLKLVRWAWADTLIDILAGATLLVAFFFLMAPVTAIFAGFYLDRVAKIVELRHYPQDPPGKELGTLTAVSTALGFGLVVLAVNLAALPMFFFGIGAIAMIVANAYLLSREYFEMAAMRHMPVDDARRLRRENTPRIFAAGFIPAFFALVPVVNLAVPLFATSYFTHLYKKVSASSP